MLESLKNAGISNDKTSILIKLYLLGYVKQFGTITKIECLNNINSYANIHNQISITFEEIETKYPIFKDTLSKFNKREQIKPEPLFNLIKTVLEVPFDKEEWKDAVEDLIQKTSDIFISNGIIQTPMSLNKVGMEILNPINGTFYDGVSGTNGTIIAAENYSKRKNGNLKFYTQELNSELAEIAIIRAFINGIEGITYEVGDTLINPAFIEGNQLMKFDYIMMDFPFGKSWNYDENELIYDKYSRYIYGTPTKSSSEWLFISHIIKSLKNEGKGVAMVTSSSLFNIGTEVIRKNIIKEDVIEAIIELPSALFSHTNIAINMIVINKSKSIKNKILFINAEQMASSISRVKKDFTDDSIALIADIYRDKKEVDEISKIIDIDKLEKHLLIPSKYVSKAEIETEKFGLVKIRQKEIEALENVKKFGEIGQFYRGINTSTCIPNDENGEYRIINLSDVQDGELNFNTIAKYDIRSNAKIASYTVKEGDIIISAKGATIKICVIPKHDEPLLISQNFIGIRLNKEYSPNFIKEYLESPLGKYLISNKQLGSTVTMLNARDLKDIDIITIPKIVQDEMMKKYQSKQKRIKEKIKELEQQALDLQIELYREMDIKKTIQIMEVE
jgi:type I restriction enzyme M protein